MNKQELHDKLEMIAIEKIWAHDNLNNETDSIEQHFIRREINRLISVETHLNRRFASLLHDAGSDSQGVYADKMWV